ncbi:MAG: formylglycine-generating enzyme family protein, partial [Gemmataceae bacterium]|nr:formylglycine-generating enzyme family protein [Gemmataceae bacterium]
MDRASTPTPWRLIVRVVIYSTLAVAVALAAANRFGWLPTWNRAAPRAEKNPGRFEGVPRTASHPCGLELVLIPAGKAALGHPEEEQPGRLPGLGKRPVPVFDPRTEAVFDEPFYLGACEVTQEQYEKVMGTNPSLKKGARLPVERVTWEDALRFCRKLGEQDGHTYRLPTGNEWEYACRAGAEAPFHTGATLAADQANFDADSPSKWNGGGKGRDGPLPVGSLPPNAWGLHDMHGNVAEWCLDLHPEGGGHRHTLCGGGWRDSADWCRSAARQAQATTSSPAIGFRVLRTLEPDPKLRLGEVRARIEEAFANPVAPLLPGILVFPPVYANAARPDGTHLAIGGAMPYCLAANIAVAYDGSRRRAALSPQVVLEALLRENTDTRRTIALSPAAVARCLRRAGCELHAICRVGDKPGGGANRLTVEMRGGGAARPDRVREHDIPSDGWSVIPGLVALDVLEWLGAKPSPEEAERLREPMFHDRESPMRLADLLDSRESSRDDDGKARRFFQGHPSPAVWYIRLLVAADAGAAVRDHDEFKPAPCGLVTLRKAGILRASGRLREALDLLLDLAPTHRGDPYYHAQLLRFGLATGESGLAELLLRLWEKEGPGLAGALVRGRLLKDWAWEARGDGFAGDLTPEAAAEFARRLGLARTCLEGAAKAGALPDAHAVLITVGMGLGLPHEAVGKEYRAAVAADPRSSEAYHAYFSYLRP